MPVIYLDVLIVLNWFLDYLLLSLTARILRVPVRRRRLVLGALVGGLCACQILLDVPMPLSLLLNLAGAALMVLAAFSWHTPAAFGKRLFVLYAVSALLAGCVSVLWRVTGSERFLSHNGVIYCDISPLLLTAFSLVSYAAIRLYDRFTHKHAPAGREYEVTIDDGCGTCTCRALYDTGLHLREPFSGSPVVVVRRETVQPFLSFPLSEALHGGGAVGLAQRHCTRLRLIPYRTVSGEGLLPAFAPARVTLRALGGSVRDITGVYIALSDEPDRGDYTALVGSDVVDLSV